MDGTPSVPAISDVKNDLSKPWNNQDCFWLGLGSAALRESGWPESEGSDGSWRDRGGVSGEGIGGRERAWGFGIVGLYGIAWLTKDGSVWRENSNLVFWASTL